MTELNRTYNCAVLDLTELNAKCVEGERQAGKQAHVGAYRHSDRHRQRDTES
jgi:hypothetical protein